MDNSYYQQLLANIEELFIKGDYSGASRLVEDELAMPYVPKETLDRLLAYRDDLKGYLSQEKPKVILDQSRIDEFLNGSAERKAQAIGFLSEANIRGYMEPVGRYMLNDEADPLVITQLLQIMRDQQLNQNVQLRKNGILLQVNPSELPDVLEQPVLQDIFRRISELFETEDPVFAQQAQSVLISFAFTLYPVLLSEQEREKVLYSVIHYVYSAYDDEKGWQSFCRSHKIDEKGLIKFRL